MKRLLTISLAILAVLTVFTACAPKTETDNVITVAATPAPHAEILEQCKPILEQQGYTLEVKVMNDYIIPNNATESGDVDANYFQHTPYLDEFNASNGTHLVSVAKVHYEPFGIYKGTSDSLELPEGAKIAVPNDATNEARALLLLEANGLIKLTENAGLTATKNDIVENPLNFEIVEMEAALLPTVLDDVNIAVINGNYAISANLKVSEALATEDAASVAAQTYANILVVKEGNQENEKVVALKNALLSETIAEYINNTYAGAVIALS
ncbi:MAG: metal ABC transporter substrate-binding protein [Clostridia bacterium]|nr:metal ABC transporter substrate-binding protein [Clostridia bacterium]